MIDHGDHATGIEINRSAGASFDGFIEPVPIGALEFDLRRRIRRCNAEGLRILGYASADFGDVDGLRLLHPPEDHGPELDACWSEATSSNAGLQKVCRNVRADGTIILCRWFYAAVRDEDGRVSGLACFFEDITRRERDRQEVESRRAMLERVIDQLPVLVWAVDERGLPAFWNKTAARVTGFPASSVVGNPAAVGMVARTPHGRVPPADLAQRGAVRDFDTAETEIVTASGKRRHIAWSNVAQRCPMPGWAAWGIGVDVTDRREAVAELAAADARYLQIFDAIALLAFVADREGRVVAANQHLLATLIRESDEVIGRDWSEVLLPEVDRPAARVRFAAAIATGSLPTNAERRVQTSTGDVRQVVWVRHVLKDHNGHVEGVAAFGLDVTDQRRAEARYRELDRRFRTLLDDANVIALMLDRDGRIVYCNRAAAAVTGYPRETLLNADWVDLLVTPSERAEARRRDRAAIDGLEPTSNGDRTIRTISGEDRAVYWVRELVRDADGRVTGAMILGHDVTDERRRHAELERYRNRLEDLVQERTETIREQSVHLARAQQLAATSEMAAGLGHDIGNVLLPMRCHLDGLEHAASLEDARAAASMLRTGCNLLEELAAELAAAGRDAREPDASTAGLDLRRWWDAFEPLASRAIGPACSVVLSLPEHLPPVAIGGNLLTRFALNIVMNAADAAVAAIEAGTTADAPDVITVHAARVPGAVELRVSDRGVGMTREVLQRVVEPFFSTKTRRFGTGLGLFVVDRGMRRIGGRLILQSDPAVGTTATLRLPLFGRGPVPVPTASIDIADPVLRERHRAAARGAGFTVLEHAATPADADVVVTDDPASLQRHARASGVLRVLVATAPPAGSTLHARVLDPAADDQAVRALHAHLMKEVTA